MKLLLPLAMLFLLCACSSAPTPRGDAAIVATYGVSWSALPSAPDRLVQRPPTYPFHAWLGHVSGSVRLVFRIDRQGRPTEIRAVAYNGPEFRDAAIAALRQWRFAPHVGGPYRIRFTFGPIHGNSADVHWD